MRVLCHAHRLSLPFCSVLDARFSQANAEGELAGYVLGKVEMGPEGMYGHVSALTVKAECRRRGVAQRLMAQVPSPRFALRCGLV